jgi:3-deoxy-D-manno-octulosonic acid kinase
VSVPRGYQELHLEGVRAFAWADAGAAVEEAIRRHGSLYDWAASAPDCFPLAGRGTVLAVEAPHPGPEARARWVVRRYLRGGAIARVLGARYLRAARPRPFRELEASFVARARHVPTPAVVAGAVYPSGPCFVRCDLVTELIPDALDLAAAVVGPQPGDGTGAGALDPHSALRAAGALIGRAATSGILHIDLNAKNIVLTRSPDGPSASLVDLDRAVVREHPRETDAEVMRARLERSLRKLHARRGLALPEGYLGELDAGLRAARGAPHDA